MSPRDFRPSEVSSGGVVFRRHGGDIEFCLINDGSHWGLPKGNVERGESPEQTAVREIQEEVGLAAGHLRIHASLPPSEYVYRRGGKLIFKRVHHFLIEAEAETELQIDPNEVTEAEWLALDSAMQRASFGDTVRALQEAVRILHDSAPGASAAGP